EFDDQNAPRAAFDGGPTTVRQWSAQLFKDPQSKAEGESYKSIPAPHKRIPNPHQATCYQKLLKSALPQWDKTVGRISSLFSRPIRYASTLVLNRTAVPVEIWPLWALPPWLPFCARRGMA